MIPLLTIHQCAQRLTVADQKVRRLILTGQLAGSKIGIEWRVKSEDLEAFIVRTQHHVVVPETARDRVPELDGNPFL